MTAGEDRDQQLLNHIILTNDDTTNLFANFITGFDQVACCGDVVLGFDRRWLDQSKTCRD